MKIYKLEQTDNNGYDTFDSIIVCAKNEEDARLITPDELHPVGDGYRFTTWAKQHENIICEEIGEANEKQERGIILGSFNSG